MLNKTNFNSMIALGTFSLILSSCSSGYSYKKPESFDEKISRYQSRSQNTNLVPEVQVNDKFSYSKTKTRAPASAVESTAEGLNQYNNKRLYFLTLYSQYQTMRPLASTESISNKLNHCPSFHTSYLTYNESSPKISEKREYSMPFTEMATLKDSHLMVKYPEFYLPVSKSSVHPRVIDVAIKENLTIVQVKELVKKAIDIHLSKTYSELSELCETGSSSNYYVYENLMTHIKTREKISADKIGMQTLLKTTVFSNMTLTNSIKKNQRVKSRGIASFSHEHSFDKEVIKRLEVPWVESYLQSK